MPIKIGDRVTHKNGGVAMIVSEVSDDRARCEYFDNDSVHKRVWFNLADLEIIPKAPSQNDVN
jgi:uncharacterized protein YodC (DUF2158 family)